MAKQTAKLDRKDLEFLNALELLKHCQQTLWLLHEGDIDNTDDVLQKLDAFLSKDAVVAAARSRKRAR